MKTIYNQLKNYQPKLLDDTNPSFAVLVLVLTKNDIPGSILLTKRKAYKGRYSNEYCFPGGKKELGDSSLLQTAIRETQEETGIIIENSLIINQLDDFHNFNKHLTRPYVAIADIQSIKNQLLLTDEVQNYYFFSLQELSEIHEDYKGLIYSTRSPSYVYLDQDEIVWGLTASILVHFDNIINHKHRDVDRLCSLRP